MPITPSCTGWWRSANRACASAVRSRSVTAKTDNWDRLGPSDLAAIATRHATTTILDPIHSRRRAVMQDRGGAIILDRHDEVKMIASPAERVRPEPRGLDQPLL